ncbi:hypothetical protein [Sphingomonas kyeonggiensis]|uniref:hypothetical protein n=1 Tax=Sphingomonas kyeonggiensis TaxID=1268553 RepID=UPI0031B59277
MSELEAGLGLRLFERGARDLKLTEEVQLLHAWTSALLTELDETAATIASGGDSPPGPLRISAPLLFSPDRDGQDRGRLRARISRGPARGDDRRPPRRHDRGRL